MTENTATHDTGDTAVQIDHFEKNIAALEGIVDTLGSGNVSLGETVRLFAQGEQLVAACTQALQSAEQRIHAVRTQEDGTLTETPIDE